MLFDEVLEEGHLRTANLASSISPWPGHNSSVPGIATERKPLDKLFLTGRG
jgi:hypothetical protein